jgi:hypothetical protein
MAPSLQFTLGRGLCGPSAVGVDRFDDALGLDFGDAAGDAERASVDDGCSDEIFQIWACEGSFFVDGYVANLAAFALQDFLGIVEVGAAIETEVDVLLDRRRRGSSTL